MDTVTKKDSKKLDKSNFIAYIKVGIKPKTKKDKMNKQEYKKQAEIIQKRLMARIYEMEAKALEAKMQAEGGLGNMDKKLEDLNKQKDELDKKFKDLQKATDDKWDKVVKDFEKSVDVINEDKQTFMEIAENWFSDLDVKIRDLENKVETTNKDISADMKQSIEVLKKDYEVSKQKMEAIRKEQSGNWKAFRNDLDKGMNSLSEKASELYKKFSS